MSPGGKSCARAASPVPLALRAVASITTNGESRVMARSSTWIGDDIDHRRLTRLHRGDGAPEGRRKIVRIDNRPFAMRAHAACDGRIVDVRIFDRRADVCLLDTASMTSGHRLQVHVFLVIGAVVMHDVEHRNAMMRRGP